MSSAEAQSHRRYSFTEYLELEWASDLKHEFHLGERLQMSAVAFPHLKISGNIYRHLGNTLEGGPCEIFNPDARVRQVKNEHYVYPDATVVCGEIEFDENDKNQTTIVNPTVVFEVLSPSTASYDLGLKFTRYRGIAALRCFVAVAQDQAFVQAFYREGEQWAIKACIGLEDVLDLPMANAQLPMAKIYDRVELPAETLDQRMSREMEEAAAQIRRKYDALREKQP